MVAHPNVACKWPVDVATLDERLHVGSVVYTSKRDLMSEMFEQAAINANAHLELGKSIAKAGLQVRAG